MEGVLFHPLFAHYHDITLLCYGVVYIVYCMLYCIEGLLIEGPSRVITCFFFSGSLMPPRVHHVFSIKTIIFYD